MNRRTFLKNVGTLAAAEATLSTFSDDLWAHDIFRRERSSGKLSILQGLTTETTTQLSVDVHKRAKVHYTLVDRDTGKVFQPQWVHPVTNSESDTRVDKIFFVELELGHRYQFNVKEGKKSLDERFLTTVDLNKKDAKIAVMSCMNDGKSART